MPPTPPYRQFQVFVLGKTSKKPESLVNLVLRVGRWYTQITISVQAKLVTHS